MSQQREAKQIESEIKYAIAGSRRREHNPQTGRLETVGFDVFEITGHTVIGDKVYLTLYSPMWVRNLERLKEDA